MASSKRASQVVNKRHRVRAVRRVSQPLPSPQLFSVVNLSWSPSLRTTDHRGSSGLQSMYSSGRRLADMLQRPLLFTSLLPHHLRTHHIDLAVMRRQHRHAPVHVPHGHCPRADLGSSSGRSCAAALCPRPSSHAGERLTARSTSASVVYLHPLPQHQRV